MNGPLATLTTLVLLAIGCSSTDDKNTDALRDTGTDAMGGGSDGATPPGATDSGLSSSDGEGCHQDDVPTEHDADGDGWSSVDFGGSDCDDADADVYPGALDTWYDGIDSNCAWDDDFDRDGDGFVRVEHAGLGTENRPETGSLPDGDCDDTDGSFHPGAIDFWHDGFDSDCAGNDDFDADADGYVTHIYAGRTTHGVPDSGGLLPGDCNDYNALIRPLAPDAPYDGHDSNCLGDDDYDLDGDGYVPTIYAGRVTEEISGSGLLPGGDCQDDNPDVHPGAPDIWYDGIDTNCDGQNDYDADGDGYTLADGDCLDTDPTVHPGAVDAWYDDIDSNCDGSDDHDADGDGWSPDEGDCLDLDPSVHPGAVDTWYDGIDSNCDGRDDYDADGDGYTLIDYLDLPTIGISTSASLPGNDCNDADAGIFPGAVDTWYDGIDSDCDGRDDYDFDRDGWTPDEGDCDDTSDTTYPGAADTWYDGIDSDCDRRDDFDADADGWRTSDGDCDDTSAGTNPGAIETWYDGIDSDCDGRDDFDADADGWRTTDGDCNDERAGINPGVVEVCDDGIDNNCNGSIDESCARDTPSSGGGGGCG